MRNLINEIVQKSAQSWFGRWLRLPQMVHAAFWLSALSAVIFLPVFRYVENSNERHRLDAELSLQQQEWGLSSLRASSRTMVSSTLNIRMY